MVSTGALKPAGCIKPLVLCRKQQQWQARNGWRVALRVKQARHNPNAEKQRTARSGAPQVTAPPLIHRPPHTHPATPSSPTLSSPPPPPPTASATPSLQAPPPPHKRTNPSHLSRPCSPSCAGRVAWCCPCETACETAGPAGALSQFWALHLGAQAPLQQGRQQGWQHSCDEWD